MRNHITVDYLVPLTVNIDLATGKVDGVGLHLDDFQSTDEVRVFAGCSGDPNLPEYLPLDHPLAKRMIALADQVRLDGTDEYPFTIEEEVNPYQYAERNVGQECSE